MIRTYSRFALLLVALAPLAACVGVPDGIEPIRGFDVERYLGTWYEVARLDHSFERGLTNVTATYSLRDEGGIAVVNRGYDERRGRWEEATGRAYFVAGENTGRLKVSFFGPFFGAYNIIALDRDDYAWSMVVGPSRGYLWLLARSPRLDPQVRDRLLAKAASLGLATADLIWVEHGTRTAGAAPARP